MAYCRSSSRRVVRFSVRMCDSRQAIDAFDHVRQENLVLLLHVSYQLHSLRQRFVPLGQLLEEDTRFRSAVRIIAQADRGEFIEAQEMEARLEQMLRS